jgi:polyadenylate-binding protein 2
MDQQHEWRGRGRGGFRGRGRGRGGFRGRGGHYNHGEGAAARDGELWQHDLYAEEEQEPTSTTA